MPLLVRGGVVLAAAGEAPAPADVLVDGDRIAAVGPDLRTGPANEVLDARGCLVMPGLVNAHMHTHNTLARGATDGLPLELWLHRLGLWVAGRSPRELYVAAALGAVEMARSGTTCACDMVQVLPWPTDEALGAVARAYADVGLRAVIAPQVADLPFYHGLTGLAQSLPPELRQEVDRQPRAPRHEVLAVMWRFARSWHGAADGRIRIGVGPTLATVCSRELLEGCADLGNQQGLVIQTHLSETKGEAVTGRASFGKSFTAYLDEVGLLGPRTVLAHAVWIERDEMALIAERGGTVAHNPISNLKLGAGVAPTVDLLDHGCAVALGTDGAASSDNLNLFGPLRLAAILPRAFELSFDRWPRAADVLRMATIGGAQAAGLRGELGEIRPGMLADLVLLDLGSSAFHPSNDLAEQIVFCEVGSSVRTVIVGGRVLVEDNRVRTVDEAALQAEADEIGRRIAADLERRGAPAARLLPHVRRAYLDANRAEWPVNRFGSDSLRSLPER